ncbi:MAG: 4Fe-4S binding domain, Cyclic nucleotide-binding domain protein [Acidobacteria bacterium]|nr:4Fe-4S binding domain, Cyclic nucleotide-binding domain protein [Acidobacteriota bacterium]
MPQVITNQDIITDAVKQLDLTSELFEEVNGKLKYDKDLEVIVRGRDYAGGKKVGPYVRLIKYEAGEEIMRQGEWGGNTFYIGVDGTLDVWVKDKAGARHKISELHPGTCFGEMSVLAGVERNATIAVPAGAKATVLEIDRPALRLLRKLPKFGQTLDNTYRVHGFGRVLEDLAQMMAGPLSKEMVDRLGKVAKFVVYGKHHVLCQEGQAIDRIILIKSGWVRRVSGIPFSAADSGISMGVGSSIGVDFLGAGNCLGLEGAQDGGAWKYNASVMARTEVFEIPIESLTDGPLRNGIIEAFSGFSAVDDKPPQTIEEMPDYRVLAATEEEISTGIVDAANLLVMDMDLCIRCGNCSLACHKVHGQSRLVRRGIQIIRPVKSGTKKTQHVLSPQVCMHCKDPECLTGCPTGSIFRDQSGYVDINIDTCIGCFDCPTQCPYDAITMVPRHPAEAVPRSVTTKLKGLLSLAAPAAPVAQESDEMVAIKCNLCENTPLNPPGARRKAYSCEENCPTGALVRVDPIEYFREAGNTLGMVFRDDQHAIGRNIHQSDPWSRAWHLGGMLLTLILSVSAAWGLARHGFSGRLAGTWLTMRWVTGLIGLSGVIVVMTYPVRKQIYRRRAGALRYWLLAHVYFGTIATVLLFMHAGLHTGGLLTTLLYLAFVGVILSGLFGIVSYTVGPRVLTSIEGEPLLIEDLTARRSELKSDLSTIIEKSEGWLREEIEERVRKRFLSKRFVLGQLLCREELKRLLAHARGEFKERTTRLATDAERATLLESVETAATLSRVDALIFVHKLLRIWIAPHVISTSFMLALMLVHIVQVVFFVVR